jgi:hypothetical protein
MIDNNMIIQAKERLIETAWDGGKGGKIQLQSILCPALSHKLRGSL